MEQEKIQFRNFKNKWHYLALFVIALCFFLGTSSYNFLTQTYSANGFGDFVKWGSPDESANYITTKLYAQESRLSFFEKYNLYVSDIMHPRSFRSDFGYIKPVSFLGMPLFYGKIAHFFGYKIIPFLTPFFASLFIFLFYFLIKELFNSKTALYSALLLAVFPPFVYYTVRSMFHNVLFTVFFFSSLYFLILSFKYFKKFKTDDRLKNQIFFFLYPALAGLFFGSSVAVRASELVWMAPSLFLLYLLNFRKIAFSKILLFLSFAFLAILPILYYNQILYFSPYLGGYAEMNKSIVAIKNASLDLAKTAILAEEPSRIKNVFSTIKHNLFPFGILPEQSFLMFKIYFAKLFPQYFYLAIFGIFLFLFKNRKSFLKYYSLFIFYFLFSFILILYYGSWEFHDNPNINSYTIGNSYTRYWLPIYLGAIPFVSYFLTRIVAKYHSNIKFHILVNFLKLNKFFIQFVELLILFLISFYSLYFVLYGSEEGLVLSAKKQIDSKKEWAEILNLTEGNAVIITRYHDKLLFPQRKVIVGLFDDKNMVAQYAKIAKYLPLYYYNFTLDKDDIDYLNKRRLGEVGLRIEKIKDIGNFTLYKLLLKDKDSS